MRLCRLLAIVFLCLFNMAPAQAIPCVNARPGWTTFFDWQAWGYERKSLGRYAALYCLDENKALKPLVYVCPHEGGGCDVSAHFDLLVAIKNAPTPEASLALGQAAAAKATYNCFDVQDEPTPRGAMCKEAIKWEEDNRARWTANYTPPVVTPPVPPVPAQVWRVKANAGRLDRPAYDCVPNAAAAATGGCIPAVKELPGVRALVGQLCRADRPYAPSGTADRRMEFGPDYLPRIVAVCALVKG